MEGEREVNEIGCNSQVFIMIILTTPEFQCFFTFIFYIGTGD